MKIINKLLSDRTFRVLLNEVNSHSYNIHAGVPQENILGILLYNLFTLDIPPLPENSFMSLFTDDTSDWTSWKIYINVAKTQIILFPYSKSSELLRLMIVKSWMDQRQRWNGLTFGDYLGLTLDSMLIFRQHCSSCCILLSTVNQRCH